MYELHYNNDRDNKNWTSKKDLKIYMFCQCSGTDKPAQLTEDGYLIQPI
jgi:hypothetical protein